MKIAINEKLTGIDASPIIKPDKSFLTLKDVCVSSILTSAGEDTEKEKWGKYEIFKKLRSAKEQVELTVEEIVVIKKAIGKLQPPLILGQCFELLEK